MQWNSGAFLVDRDAVDEVLNLFPILDLKERCSAFPFPVRGFPAAHAQVIDSGEFGAEGVLPGGMHRAARHGLPQGISLVVPGCYGGGEETDVAELGQLLAVGEIFDQGTGGGEKAELGAVCEQAQVGDSRGVDLEGPAVRVGK